MIAGTIRNAVKQMKIMNEWESKKKSGNIFQHKNSTELTEEEQLLNTFKEQLESNRESEEYTRVYNKLMSGQDLTNEELEMIKQRDPKTYMEYKADKMEQEAYERRLRNCKTKEEAERLHVNKMNGKLAELKSIVNNPNIPKGEKLKAVQRILGDTNRTVKVYQVFTKSVEFKELPTEEDVRESKRIEKEMREEELRDTQIAYEGEAQAESEENGAEVGLNNAKNVVNAAENEASNRVSETEKKILEEMYELEEKHFGKSKKTVQIDVTI